ncbi:methyltransferase [Aliidiomarina sanyensis]|uniref:Methyltransferase n=1 Tax=Aliidiomarina sanyensis TaxID=1249555 RepID=A0A432WPM8_9GAMM|nr:methyltransferase [Aliidiomarina sanyensis]RUO35669.1 methyltransferase [Aliidiomarina sanyensis]
MSSSPSVFQTVFHTLSSALKEHRELLAIQPMHWATQSPIFPWTNAALSEAALGLGQEALTQIESNPERASAYFEHVFPGLQNLLSCEAALFAPAQAVPSASSTPFWIRNGIGGRKLAQIEAFLAAVGTKGKPKFLMEWCAGKGYLGRIAAHHGMKVISVELQQALCDAGESTASQWSLPQTFVQADVLKQHAALPFHEVDAAFALHACGGLHVSLLQASIAAQLPMIAIAPCCYHLHTDAIYRPLSQAGRAINLSLTREQLKFSVQGQVTGGARIEKLRHQEVQWRLAYESWRQEVMGSSTYRPLSSAPKQLFMGDYDDFARWAVKQHELNVALPPSWEPYLERAKQHYVHIRRIEAVRSILRRPLELWLVLDRALYLCEQGYDVSLQQFCDRTTSPRNILITARAP